jgi:hypothetical protein
MSLQPKTSEQIAKAAEGGYLRDIPRLVNGWKTEGDKEIRKRLKGVLEHLESVRDLPGREGDDANFMVAPVKQAMDDLK